MSDLIISKNNYNYYLVANSALSLIRPHPVSSKDSYVVFKNRKTSIVLGLVGNLLILLLLLLISIPFGRSQKFGKKKIISNVLFISHFVNKTHMDECKDFYFGAISSGVRSAGINVTTAFINHNRTLGRDRNNQWCTINDDSIVFERLLGLKDETRIAVSAIFSMLKLIMISLSTKSKVGRNFLLFAANKAVSRSTLNALRLAVQFSNLLSAHDFKTIVTTYEGHPWERLIFSVARRYSGESVTRIGYQHAHLFEKQHAISRDLSSEYNPDLILTAGDAGRLYLQRQMSNLTDLRILTLGSERCLEKKVLTGAGEKVGEVVLVIPEGTIEECDLLFRFCVSQAISSPKLKFVFRLHPCLTFSKLKKILSCLSDLPENVELSERRLEEDLSIARYALYRGSSAVIQACCAGLFPIYFDDEAHLAVDPLHAVSSSRARVTSNDSVESILKINYDCHALGQLTSYSESVYTPLRLSVIYDVLA